MYINVTHNKINIIGERLIIRLIKNGNFDTFFNRLSHYRRYIKVKYRYLNNFILFSIDLCYCFCIVLYFSIYIALLKAWAFQKRSRLHHWYCIGANTLKDYRQLRVKDLPKVPTWRLNWNSNLRLFGRKAANLPLSHHAQHLVILFCIVNSKALQLTSSSLM